MSINFSIPFPKVQDHNHYLLSIDVVQIGHFLYTDEFHFQRLTRSFFLSAVANNHKFDRKIRGGAKFFHNWLKTLQFRRVRGRVHKLWREEAAQAVQQQLRKGWNQLGCSNQHIHHAHPFSAATEAQGFSACPQPPTWERKAVFCVSSCNVAPISHCSIRVLPYPRTDRYHCTLVLLWQHQRFSAILCLWHQK